MSRVKEWNTVIPSAFANLVKMTLTKLAARGLLHPTLIDVAFWTKWPKKFISVCQYENSKKKQDTKKVCLLYTSPSPRD